METGCLFRCGGGRVRRPLLTAALISIALLVGCTNSPAADVSTADGTPTTDAGSAAPDVDLAEDRFVPARYFFDPIGLHQVRIDLPPKTWTAVLANAANPKLERLWHEASVTFDGEVWKKVALRNFGEGSQEANPSKPNVRLKFNLYDPAGDGPSKLNNVRLKAAGEDPSFLREPMAYDALRAMGAKAPRYSWAQVNINGTHYGLYQIVEQVDSRFFKFHFGDKTGINYDIKSGCGGFNCPKSGCADLAARYELRSVKSGFGHVLAVAQAVADPKLSDAAFTKTLEAHVDVDALLAVYALELFGADPDGLMRAAQNLELYVDPKTDRLHVIRSGTDTAFYLTPDFDTPWADNKLCAGRVDALFARIQATDGLRQRFEARLRALRCTHLAIKPTAVWLDSYIAKLKDADAHGGKSMLLTGDIGGFIDELTLWLQQRNFAADKRYGNCN